MKRKLKVDEFAARINLSMDTSTSFVVVEKRGSNFASCIVLFLSRASLMQRGVPGYWLGVSTPLRMFELPGMLGLNMPFPEDEDRRNNGRESGMHDGGGHTSLPGDGHPGGMMWPDGAVPSTRLQRFATEMNKLQASCSSTDGSFQT
jgi:hypothetical protein